MRLRDAFFVSVTILYNKSTMMINNLTDSYPKKTVEKIVHQQILERKYFLISSSIIISVAAIVIALHHAEDPKHPAYLNNFINPNDRTELLKRRE